MRRTSKKRARQLRLYFARVREWKRENPTCKACECVNRALKLERKAARATSECHHMAGREGELLLDERYWLPVCGRCHCWISDNAAWAFANGFRVRMIYRSARNYE